MQSTAGDRLDPAGLGSPLLVVAPHPDDESIGCGGLLGLTAHRGGAAIVVFVTDGSGSHPGSASHPPARLARLRACEAREALSVLGIAPEQVRFGALRDRFVPAPGEAGFAAAVDAAIAVLEEFEPQTLVLPSGSDAHGDHCAANAIWRRAAAVARIRPARTLEYVVWPAQDRPPRGRPLHLDIAEVHPLKQRAIAAHRSQHGLVIADDPSGFVLPSELLARAVLPYETYYEAEP